MRTFWMSMTVVMALVGIPADPEEAPGALGSLPATFFGELPCASCPGIQMTVTLRPDGIFLAREVYQEAEDGRNETFHSLGRWSLSDDGRALTLRGGTEAPRRFAVEGPSGLRILDTLGRPIDSELDYSLSRVDPDPIGDTMRLRGLYTYMADAARFGECPDRPQPPGCLREGQRGARTGVPRGAPRAGRAPPRHFRWPPCQAPGHGGHGARGGLRGGCLRCRLAR